MARARTTSISPEAELPIQAPVEEPIINSPFEEPKQFWKYEKDGKAHRQDGRRPASYFWTTQKVMSNQVALDIEIGDYGSEELALVNALRKDVKRWREGGYENAMKTTRRLFEHWRGDARKERGARRFFFCQLEAVETLIYLNEILAGGKKIRWKTEVTAEDFAALLAGKKPPLAAGMPDEFFPTLRDGGLTRLGCGNSRASVSATSDLHLLRGSLCA
ncbi:MAG: hypothetical protein LBS59_01360 [Puniceicoccales bacterium]|jgi:type III restriction enzyme|nr:hypothetical protein [Puniceicoccales bacterium]